MKWRGARRSTNVEDRRGARGAGRAVAGGGGLMMVLLVAASLFFPDAVPFLRMIQGGSGGGGEVQSAPIDDEINGFVAATLAYTEDTWSEAFAAGAFPRAGRTYEPPVLVLFSGQVSTRCGPGTSSSGPFYCPADKRIYIDPSFYTVMARQLGAPGDFAQAYVIAHEVAHHVQNLAGVLPEVHQLRMRSSQVEGNRLTVRLELQADCLAGVWTRHAEARHQILERGDLQEALRAAHSVGDDALARMQGRAPNPDEFTHGTSEQRSNWFARGLEGGSVGDCDTFSLPYARL